MRRLFVEVALDNEVDEGITMILIKVSPRPEKKLCIESLKFLLFTQETFAFFVFGNHMKYNKTANIRRNQQAERTKNMNRQSSYKNA